MSKTIVLVLLLYVVMSVGGLVTFKLGASKQLSITLVNGNLSINANILTILGMLFYVISFLLYLFVVSKLDLSYIAPICTGLIYIMTFVAAKFVLGENITPAHYIGAVLILSGVLLINVKG